MMKQSPTQDEHWFFFFKFFCFFLSREMSKTFIADVEVELEN